MQFKSQHDTENEKKEDVEKPEPIVADRNQYNFDSETINDEKKIPGVRDYGYVFR